jgi:hypothetical protein
MAKRFFDTEIFNKSWFRKLKPKYKTFWIYALSQCNIAGVLEIDFEACDFFIGEKVDKVEIETIFKDQFLKIDDKRYFIKDFVEFQNGTTLKKTIPAHNKIISILEKYSLYDRVHSRVDTTHIVVVEDIVEVGVVEKVVVEVEVLPNVDFEFFWDAYDKKVGEREKIKRKWEALTDREREDVMEHIHQYKLSQPDKKYRKNPETYLNNKSWKDEIINANGINQQNKRDSDRSGVLRLAEEAIRNLSGIDNGNIRTGS